MRRIIELAMMAGGQQYWQAMKALFGASIIAFWPQNELAGLTAFDISGYAAHGTYRNTGVTYGQPGFFATDKAALFDGAAGRLALYSAYLAGALDCKEFSILTWIKPADSLWSTGSSFRGIYGFLADINNTIGVSSGGVDNRITFSYKAAGVTVSLSLTGIYDLSWIPIVATVSYANLRARFYRDGNLALPEAAISASFVGSIAAVYAWYGANSGSVGYANMVGQDTIIVNREVTPAEVAAFSQPVFTLPGYNFIVDFGDSRCANRGWQHLLTNALNVSPGGTWKDIMLGVSSTTVVSWRAVIDAWLAVRYGNPSVILCNIGINDASAGTAEATFKEDYLYILDALHAKWPGAKIYCAHFWKRSLDAMCATYNGYVDFCIAARSSFCCAGLDEPTSVKAADNGAANTTDGMHYSTAGLVVVAAAWKTAMGI